MKQNISNWIKIVEGQFRKDSSEEFVPSNDQLDDIKSKFLPDWEMLDHRILQATYKAKDHRQAMEFVEHINSLSERLDHFAQVTQDVAEVTVKTTTTDVQALTILDFQLALSIDYFAEQNDIEQERMSGNFSDLDEGKKDACYHKVKSRVKIWPSAYASGQLVQCRKRGAANWGKGSKKK